MSYEERRQNSYRTIMDIGMGAFYIIIGGMVAIMRSFANIAIPTAIAIVLGGMMVIGGGARLYRGIKTVTAKKESGRTYNP